MRAQEPDRRSCGRPAGIRGALDFAVVDGADWLLAELAAYACAACGQGYERERMRLLAERDDLFFVDLACAHCGSQAVAIVTVRADGKSDPSLEPGDLVAAGGGASPAERSPDPDARPVDADDVLFAHELLAGFEGDARALLARLDGRGR